MRWGAASETVAGVTVVLLLVLGPAAGSAPASGRREIQTTDLISARPDGGIPDGASTHAVISGDRRLARVIAFQSQASDLVPGDANGQEDVFAIFRRGHFDNTGGRWEPGPTQLISRTPTGAPSNGPSFAPAVGGSLYSPPRCIAFLSAASNLVAGDTNGKVDAFVSWGHAGKPRRLLLPRSRQPTDDATAVAVSGDCSRIAFVSGGRLYLWMKSGTRRLRAPAPAADPSFSTGNGNDLVFGAPAGVYLASSATGRPRLVGPGGWNPVYNDTNRQVLAYEVYADSTTQIMYEEFDLRHEVISHDAFSNAYGDGPSRDPVIGNSGYYVAFESEAENMWSTVSRHLTDRNKRPDVYLYTDVRHVTLVQSVITRGEPLGGQNPSMSFYANYVLFDAPAPFGEIFDAPHQIYMRYLGPV